MVYFGTREINASTLFNYSNSHSPSTALCSLGLNTSHPCREATVGLESWVGSSCATTVSVGHLQVLLVKVPGNNPAFMFMEVPVPWDLLPLPGSFLQPAFSPSSFQTFCPVFFLRQSLLSVDPSLWHRTPNT